MEDKILEKLFYDDESFEPNGYIEIYFHKQEQDAIKNLIARNKELEKENKNLKDINQKLLNKYQERLSYGNEEIITELYKRLS